MYEKPSCPLLHITLFVKMIFLIDVMTMNTAVEKKLAALTLVQYGMLGTYDDTLSLKMSQIYI